MCLGVITLNRWRFSCNGACVQIPQIDDPKAHATAIASARSGVQVRTLGSP